jgi:DNA-directed RNA polymerase subunit RPC12/RpoP
MNIIEKQFCPICQKEVGVNERYPKYICTDCSSKTTDIEGRPVDYFNTTLLGAGCQGKYKDTTSEIYSSNHCYVNGILCIAEEARFGGIVIQKQ